MDGKRFKVEDVREVRPGHYVISFTPCDEYRDGKEHVISLRIKNWDTPIQKTLTIPESGAAPSPTEAQAV